MRAVPGVRERPLAAVPAVLWDDDGGTMKRITVTACSGCPFDDTGDGRPFCKADAETRYTEPDFGKTWATGRPDWCPLNEGPVAVGVDDGTCQERQGSEPQKCQLPAGHDGHHRHSEGGCLVTWGSEGMTLSWDGVFDLGVAGESESGEDGV